MNNLRARVLARFDEIEATASAAHLPFRDAWRTGRKVGRTLYTTETGIEDGHLIGVLDSPALAAHAALFGPAFAFGLVAGLRSIAEAHAPCEAVYVEIDGSGDPDEIRPADEPLRQNRVIEEPGSMCLTCDQGPECSTLLWLAEALGLEVDDDDA
jgi:hypothetical protein